MIWIQCMLEEFTTHLSLTYIMHMATPNRALRITIDGTFLSFIIFEKVLNTKRAAKISHYKF